MKKIIFVILSLSLALTAASAFAAEPEPRLGSDQLNELKNYGVFQGDPDGDFRLDDSLTRAEALKVILSLDGKEIERGGEMPFGDVPDNHWAYDYIVAGKNQGIISGDGSGNFRPDEIVTNEEFVKMLVCRLGYEPKAMAKGGWPYGYMRIGEEIEITGGMMLETGSPITRNNASVMLYRALDVNIMLLDREQSGEEVTVYSTSEDTFRKYLEEK